MNIQIDAIMETTPIALGASHMASYLTHFRSAAFSGWARFVPAENNVKQYVGQEITVEISHDGISNFFVTECEKQEITALTERGDYHVCGKVQLIARHSSPIGNRTAYIDACGATFCLGMNDLKTIEVSEGDNVTFDAHGLSLWDEAI